MNTNAADLKEQFKKALFDSISAQIDLIGYVPDDIARLAAGFDFGAGAVGRAPDDTGVSAVAAPALRPDKDSLAGRVNRYYDEAFYNPDGIMGMLLGGTEYRNIGYWDETTKTQNQASERLQDALLDFIPEKSGRILDVACGMGASTRRLLNHYPPENVWAINISEKQVASTRKNAPGCNAMVMNAVDLRFEDAFFDAVLCIEAAFHFETRRAFLEGARRVLKDGGRLVLSDVLFTSPKRLEQYPVLPGPENHIATAGEYEALLADVGFRDIVVKDVSREVWGAHFLHVVNRIHEEFYQGKLNLVHLTQILWTYYQLNAVTGLCLFVSARK
ncbi:MAG TPA: methyltransferase domain-containing protein [Azospirillum sp.]